jgi:hypothetical protein
MQPISTTVSVDEQILSKHHCYARMTAATEHASHIEQTFIVSGHKPDRATVCDQQEYELESQYNSH